MCILLLCVRQKKITDIPLRSATHCWLLFALDSDLLRTANHILKMAGRVFTSWWAKMSPYYTGAYQEMWVGLGVMTYLYYKVSYGGKKAVKGKPAH
ncbi:ATP synthase F(0) complex subunit j, mitochondrial [Salmo salar]|uniref:ATP synthase F(0) complex subunit j, mitochondrial n=1 Tax=Salmo salar TaxID=8030 RepID=A0A1S3MAF3_SALSA|nr:ATP synthase subunit ATP5MPL, mitochondrial [Salmo salar]|eukprot:XP_014000157.1 PREDICTED: 6.8 kDa mitochondrial proteolipid [Salmo salar]